MSVENKNEKFHSPVGAKLHAKRIVTNLGTFNILQIIFIVWVGTHTQYDKLDAKKIGYDKTH